MSEKPRESNEELHGTEQLRRERIVYDGIQLQGSFTLAVDKAKYSASLETKLKNGRTWIYHFSLHDLETVEWYDEKRGRYLCVVSPEASCHIYHSPEMKDDDLQNMLGLAREGRVLINPVVFRWRVTTIGQCMLDIPRSVWEKKVKTGQR
jgi:hypothetical protein